MLNNVLRGGPEQRFVEVLWSGSATEYRNDPVPAISSYLSGLKKAKALASTGEDCKVHVIAHSWGTVVTYQAMVGQFHTSTPVQKDKIDSYFTMGSPLNSQGIFSSYGQVPLRDLVKEWTGIRNLHKPSQVNYWKNFYSSNDNISGSISGIGNYNYGGDHSGYWSDPNVIRLISSRISSSN